MKKFLVILAMILVCGTAWADGNKMVWKKTYSDELAASSSTTTDPISFDALQLNGFFSCQVIVTGDGTLKIEYEVTDAPEAANGVPPSAMFKTPSGASDIVTAHTKTSGSDADGNDFYQFPVAGSPIFGGWFRLRLTETSTTDSVTFTIYTRAQ